MGKIASTAWILCNACTAGLVTDWLFTSVACRSEASSLSWSGLRLCFPGWVGVWVDLVPRLSGTGVFGVEGPRLDIEHCSLNALRSSAAEGENEGQLALGATGARGSEQEGNQ